MFRRPLFFRVALRSGTGFTDGTARPDTQRTFEAAARRGNLPRRAVLLLAALLVTILAFAPRAEAFVYWASGEIGRADLDGTNVDAAFIPQALGNSGVAVDGKHLYWVRNAGSGGPGFIARANLSGTGVDNTFISVARGTSGVAVDGAHLYWNNWEYPDVSGTIGRADLDGSNVDQSFIALAEAASTVAIGGGHIYWIGGDPDEEHNRRIGRADLDGSNVDPNFIDPAETFPGGLAVNATHIFWTAPAGFPGNRIGRANLGGTGVDESFITGAKQPCGVAVDEGHVYWSNRLGLYEGVSTIGRADLDGSNVDQNFIGPPEFLFFPCGLAADALSTPPSPPPPNDFSFGDVRKNKSKGTAKLTVDVPGPGELDLAETKKLKADDESTEAGGTEQLLLNANGKTRKKLNARGKVTVEAKVTYTPFGGEPYTESKNINLVKR